MAGPDVEFSDATDPDGGRCAFCLQPVDLSTHRACPRCRAVFHPDCWKANAGRCAVYGCERATPPPPERRPRRPTFQREPLLAPPRRWTWTSSGVVVPVILIAINVFRLSSSPSTPSVRDTRIEVSRLRTGARLAAQALAAAADARRFLENMEGMDDLPADWESAREEADRVRNHLVRAREPLLRSSSIREERIQELIETLGVLVRGGEGGRARLR